MMWRAWIWAVLAAAVSGCQQGGGPALMDTALHDELRDQVALADEPADAVTLHDLYDQLAALGEGVTTENEVVVVGRVGGLEEPDDPANSRAKWTLGVAEFKLVDPAGGDDASAEHEHADAAEGAESTDATTAAAEEKHAHHDHSNPDEECPFCNHEGPGIQTIVRFVDEQGDLLPVDARVLFKLSGEDIVVVRGKARLEPGSMVITGSGMYVRH